MAVGTYVVKPGDSLSKIAAANGMTVAQLLKLNPALTTDPKYKGGQLIYAGTRIKTTAAKPTTGTGTGTTGATGTGATGIPTFNNDPATQALRKLQSGQTLTNEERALLGMSPIDDGLSGVKIEPVVDEPDKTVVDNTGMVEQQRYALDPTTGEFLLDQDGNKIPVGPGGSAADILDYLTSIGSAGTNLQRKRESADRAIEQARITGDVETRAAEREIYNAKMLALSGLAQRGISGAPGLSLAAERAATVQPLANRTSAIEKMAATTAAQKLLLADEERAAAEAKRKAVNQLTRATNLTNQLGGKTNG